MSSAYAVLELYRYQWTEGSINSRVIGVQVETAIVRRLFCIIEITLILAAHVRCLRVYLDAPVYALKFGVNFIHRLFTGPALKNTFVSLKVTFVV